MLRNQTKWFIGYGLALILLGAALIAYDPHAGKVALYWKAKTGFFIASGIGLVAIIGGLLTRAGKRVGIWIGLLAALLGLGGFFMQAKKFFRLAGGEDPTRQYAAVVTAIMAGASFLTLVNGARGVSTLPPEK